MPNVRLSEAASEELDAAYRWYEGQRVGLGDELLDQFLQTIARIEESPSLYPVELDSVRRAPVRRFPYAVFYRVADDTIVVVAFFHGRRDPDKWRRR